MSTRLDDPRLVSFQNVKASGAGWTATCPAHEDRRASLSIGIGQDERLLLTCHAGCTLNAILEATGLTRREIGRQRSTTHDANKVVATYEYCDEEGDVLYEVVRYEPKDFRVRRPSDAGYQWSLGDVRRVVYLLPDIKWRLAHPEYRDEHNLPHDVFIVEGEADVERLWRQGLVATTNVGGASKWRTDYTTQLIEAGAQSVIILPDNDDAGRQHAAKVARSCQAAGLPFRIVDLPDLPPKGDVRDWLRSREIEDLVAVVTSSSSSSSVTTTPTEKAAEATLAETLDAVETYIRRYVVLSPEQAAAVTLWTAHTHALDAFDCTPYLHVTSATKRTGKTRLLEVQELIVARPWFTGRTSAAALVRKVDTDKPTLLLDESDAAFSGEKEYAEALRGILNSGYKRSGRTTLCVGQGANLSFRDFSTFSAKAIAGIGDLPSTVADRAIPVELRRKTGHEVVERFRERDARSQSERIHHALAAWGARAVDEARAARPDLPAALNDRAQDIWEPLLAIADLAAGPWPERARQAAVVLMGSRLADEDIAVELLSDICAVFSDTGAAFITSAVLLERLCKAEDRPWATWRRGQPLSGHGLARLLKPFGVVPVQNTERTARGYYADRFADAWSRYPPVKASERPDSNKDGPQLAFSECPAPISTDTSRIAKTSIKRGLSDTRTLQRPDTRAAEVAGALEY